MLNRREFVGRATCGLGLWYQGLRAVNAANRDATTSKSVAIESIESTDDVFRYVRRAAGRMDQTLYRQVLGAANPFKEGDAGLHVAAVDEGSRANARRLLSRTRIRDLNAHPVFADRLHELVASTVSGSARDASRDLTLGELKQLLLESPEDRIKQVAAGLSSDVIGCVVKLMSNAELITVGANLFHPLPGSQIGARGYLGARIQPNSPTDNVDDIRWQVFNGWSYAVGDVVLGTNPVSSERQSVRAIELALQELLSTFDLTEVMPHCVLSHIDVQAEVEEADPGSTGIWFQSIAGTDTANETFDISIDKMLAHAARRSGRYGLYFETGQGADYTNGHGHGFDMVLHESRKYGFARALKAAVEAAQEPGLPGPWVHLNDVAGFIGPEVFRSREQLVRCCLEDIVMGKLHGLTIGLDVCSTLHMDVSLDDLDWCLDQIMPANPAYLMALPTKIDPMLGYLTTGFQDHVRLREKFGLRVNDAMWKFFQSLEVIDAEGRPTEHFGDPLWVYLKYRRRQGDLRPEPEIRGEGTAAMRAVRERGVFLATGHGARPGDLAPALDREIRRIYVDAKESIWAELDDAFVAGIPQVLRLETQSEDRTDYILHPQSGEQLSVESVRRIQQLRQQHAANVDVQIVVSDGLNALSIMEPGHLVPFLGELRERLDDAGFKVSAKHLVVDSGRVRAGYQIGELLFGGLGGRRAILHVIGERPGTGHRTFSVYLTAPDGAVWGTEGRVDHNITRVVSGIATTALAPTRGADQTLRLLQALWQDA